MPSPNPFLGDTAASTPSLSVKSRFLLPPVSYRRSTSPNLLPPDPYSQGRSRSRSPSQNIKDDVLKPLVGGMRRSQSKDVQSMIYVQSQLEMGKQTLAQREMELERRVQELATKDAVILRQDQDLRALRQAEAQTQREMSDMKSEVS